MSTRFDDFALGEAVLDGIREAGFDVPTDVQARTLTETLRGRDVTVQSQTGTGKTAAFLITIYHLLATDERFHGKRALIVAPTRELAVQIEQEAQLLGKNLPYRVGCFYGGVGYGKQEQHLKEGVELIVGTPGRLLDFNRSGKLDFRDVGICVIDEADRLFDMGFYPDLQRIMRRMVPREERLTMLFSATLSTRVLNISWEHMNDPVDIEIEPEQVTVDEVEQELYHVARTEKLKLLLGLIERYQPANALIFVNTKSMAEELAKRLSINGYAAHFMMGDLPQKKRLQIIDRLKAGTTRFLVATDVAARGLHVDDLELVVNYDLPEDPESYVHRIGRTARAGRTGRAVSLACERYVYGLEPIEKLIGMKIPSGVASEELIAEDKSEGMSVRALGLTELGPQRASRSDKGRGNRGRAEGGPGRKRAERRPSSGARQSAPSGGKRRPEPRPERSGHGRRREEEAVPSVQSNEGPSKDASMEERLAYYRRKYGEEFAVVGGSGGEAGESATESSPASKGAKEAGQPLRRGAAESEAERRGSRARSSGRSRRGGRRRRAQTSGPTGGEARTHEPARARDGEVPHRSDADEAPRVEKQPRRSKRGKPGDTGENRYQEERHERAGASGARGRRGSSKPSRGAVAGVSSSTERTPGEREGRKGILRKLIGVFRGSE